jgi:hypothetical protein
LFTISDKEETGLSVVVIVLHVKKKSVMTHHPCMMFINKQILSIPNNLKFVLMGDILEAWLKFWWYKYLFKWLLDIYHSVHYLFYWDKEETGLSVVVIVLLIVGGFVLIAGIVLAVACYYCIRKRRQDRKHTKVS